MKNKLTDLRDHIFVALERLNENDVVDREEVARASAIADLGQVLVNSAKVEVDFLRAVGMGEAVSGQVVNVGVTGFFAGPRSAGGVLGGVEKGAPVAERLQVVVKGGR